MHINVHDILVESVGFNRAYKITGEHPELGTVKLVQDIEGEITISKLESSLLVRGQITTEIELECDRCLRAFTRPITVTFSQIFAEAPTDDELPVAEDGTIDLAPLVEQEIVLHLPIKILHDPNCQGIENADETYTKKDTSPSLQAQARITKGTKRGST
jgi:uncharacterized metal-binding protein YceD (DUF177 family)